MHIYMYIYISLSLSIHTHIRIYVHIVCIYIYIYIYIHVYTGGESPERARGARPRAPCARGPDRTWLEHATIRNTINHLPSSDIGSALNASHHLDPGCVWRMPKKNIQNISYCTSLIPDPPA